MQLKYETSLLDQSFTFVTAIDSPCVVSILVTSARLILECQGFGFEDLDF
jgi:hypothetical protein